MRPRNSQAQASNRYFRDFEPEDWSTLLHELVIRPQHSITYSGYEKNMVHSMHGLRSGSDPAITLFFNGQAILGSKDSSQLLRLPT